MGERIGSHLQMESSFNPHTEKLGEYRSRTINPNSFHDWSRDNMHKSTYAHYHSRNSVQPKHTAIPGYAGFVPSIHAQNIYAKSFSAMAKQSFSQSKLGSNTHGLATTGFNIRPEVFLDQSKLASSSKYGKTALQRAHPNWDQPQWTSTTHDFFKNPNTLLNPTFRETDKHLQTQKPPTKGSGFVTNHSYLDGNGWKPLPVLNGDLNRTEYRDRFNAQMQFHRNAHAAKPRQLKLKQSNYKYN